MSVVDTYKGSPRWARIAAPVTGGLVLIGALGGGGEDTKVEAVSTTTEAVDTTLDDYTLVNAVDELDGQRPFITLIDGVIEKLVETTCEAAGSDNPAELAELLIATLNENAATALSPLGEVAQRFCPDDVAESPRLLQDASDLISESATTTTAEITEPTEAEPTTTAPRSNGSSQTTAPRATNPPATAAPTTAPPATAPPTTQAPPSGSVHPGAFCEPAGATGYTSEGTPMTCSTHKCDGTPYEQPRWRRSNC